MSNGITIISMANKSNHLQWNEGIKYNVNDKLKMATNLLSFPTM